MNIHAKVTCKAAYDKASKRALADMRKAWDDFPQALLLVFGEEPASLTQTEAESLAQAAYDLGSKIRAVALLWPIRQIR